MAALKIVILDDSLFRFFDPFWSYTDLLENFNNFDPKSRVTPLQILPHREPTSWVRLFENIKDGPIQIEALKSVLFDFLAAINYN